jgi:hypothetical protein
MHFITFATSAQDIFAIPWQLHLSDAHQSRRSAFVKVSITPRMLHLFDARQV